LERCPPNRIKSNQHQRLLDLRIRNQAEERGLLKLHGQPLAQRVVKHRIARLVIEVREDKGILVGQLGSRHKIARKRPDRHSA
jgi:hypothetical protein